MVGVMAHRRINPELALENNQRLQEKQLRDLEALTGLLARRNIQIEPIIVQAAKIEIALPSWGFSQGGTRFGRFPLVGEPRDLEEKLYDAAVVNDLTGLTPRVSLH